MFKNYLKTAVRNLLRYKGFSLINILSLAIGITGCLVIALFVWDEKQFDRSIEGGENITVFTRNTKIKTAQRMALAYLRLMQHSLNGNIPKWIQR